MEIVSNVSSINKFPEDAQILRNIADSIDAGDFVSKGIVVVMITDQSLEVFGGGKVGEDMAISLLERGKYTLCRMLESANA